MLLLYTKGDCKYCEKVKDSFLMNSIVYEERDIEGNEGFLKEAQEKGARTMPFLVDTSANTTVSGSDEIIDYAREYSF